LHTGVVVVVEVSVVIVVVEVAVRSVVAMVPVGDWQGAVKWNKTQ